MATTKSTATFTTDDWDALPFRFGAEEMAKVIGAKNVRYVQNHAQELGGRKLAGKWCFLKPTVAKMLGIDA